MGVFFYSKLNWSSHIEKTINKCKKTLQAIKLISKFFTIDEKINIVTSLFYSKLYYGAEVWLIPSLKFKLKNKLLSISTKALRLAAEDYYNTFSPCEIHIMFKRFTPTQMMHYISLVNLYRCFNNEIPETIWIELQCNALVETRANRFYFPPKNNLRVGLNILTNRLSFASLQINNDDLKLSYIAFKLLSKKKCLLL